MTMPKPRSLAILLFKNAEILDFCGPYEVFSVANRFTQPTAFNVFTVAEHSPVVAANGLSVNPDCSLSDCVAPDILLVPGGIGSRTEMHNEQLIAWIQQAAANAELVLSVCTGALLLGKAGLLDELETTTHHVAYETLREIAPTTTVHEDRRFVDNGKIITSAGIAAGIDMSLHVIQRLCGNETAAATSKQMEYPWET